MSNFPVIGDGPFGGDVLSVDGRTGAVILADLYASLGHTHSSAEILSFLGYVPENSADKAIANGYASLDADGKLPTSQLPPLSITSVFVVASEAAQLALTVEEGDVAIRTDENKTYIALNDVNASMSDWEELLSPTGGVLSVDGRTGTVTLGDLYANTSGSSIINQVAVASDASGNVKFAPVTIDPNGDVKNVRFTEQSNILFLKSGTGIKSTTDGTSSGPLDNYIFFDPTEIIKFFHGFGSAPSLELKATNVIVKPFVESTSSGTGALLVQNGGVGIAGNLNVAGVISSTYAEMYFNNNAVAQIMGTPNEKHGVLNYTSGSLSGWLFEIAGGSASITAFADYSGTVAGTVKITTSAPHGLFAGYIVIHESTNYNGVILGTWIDSTNLYITHSWDGDDGASLMEVPTTLRYGGTQTRTYDLNWNVSVTKAVGLSAVVTYTGYLNGTAQIKSVGRQRITDIESAGGGDIITVASGDRVFMTVESTNADNLTMNYGALRLTEI